MEKEVKSENRQIILNHALTLFSEKGFDAVGVQQIADESGITKPTLYYYYKSKTGLLEALLEQKLNGFLAKLEEISERQDSLQSLLVQVALCYFELAEKEREAYFLMQALYYSAKENPGYKIIEPYMSRQFYCIQGIFDRFRGHLGNMRGRQWQFALGFAGMITEYILYYYNSKENKNHLTDEGVAYSLVHQFMHGIYS